jgi:hypothetical protein
MSQYLVELYSPNARWQALSAAQRTQFLGGIQSAMGALSALGVEVLALDDADPRIDRATGHRFVGIWRFPDQQARDALLAGIKASGWYDYFDHVNAACGAGGFASHVAALLTD